MKKMLNAVRHAGRAFVQKYNEAGEEMPDPKPVEVPVGFKKPPTLHEQIKMFIRTEEWRRRMEDQGAESFDEANDFEVGDEEFDEIPTVHEMQEEFVKQAREAAEEEVAKRVRIAQERRKAREATPPKDPALKSQHSPEDEPEA